MKNTLADSYAQALAELEGDDFQAEICARFGSVILGFQQVPAAPQGDGGLDGLSHDGQHGYCCYGPEHNAFKKNAERVSAIASKFTDDLRRLFELTTLKGKLVHADNAELGTILPSGQRLLQVTLVVNWFEDHRVIGRILTKVAEFKKASQCRFVDPDLKVVILGPKELANAYPVDEFALGRVRQRKFVETVEAIAHVVAIGDPRSFDYKMDVLRELCPDQAENIATLAEHLRSDWRTALAFERTLGDTAPTLHQALERSRKQIAMRVISLMLSSVEPWTQLHPATEIAEKLLAADFGAPYGPLIPMVASGEVARLIGECPIGWQKRAASDA